MANADPNPPSPPETPTASGGGATTRAGESRTSGGAKSASSQPNQHTSDHLANERTFLAWIRTSISMIGLGFVVAKFTVWLRELSLRLDQQAPPRTGLSLPLGVTLMALGGVLAIIAAWRYRSVKRAIQSNQSAAAESTMVALSVSVALIAIALVAYMLATS
jgi:putative membrane protein